MRLVQVTVPVGKRDAILGVLDEQDIEYAVTDETANQSYAAILTFPIPTWGVEQVLDDLRAEGLDDGAYSVIVDAEAVLSPKFDHLEEHYEMSVPEERIAHEEIHKQAEEFIPAMDTYLLLIAVSALVATAGLLLDSPAVVVGSMVIAPLIGPAMATSVGTVLNDSGLFRSGVKYQLIGFGLALASATVFAIAVRALFLIPPTVEITALEQVAGRLTPDLLTLTIALGSGAAGARSLSSDISTGIVGVMIAAALVPPVAAVGIGIAWQQPNVVTRAGLIVLANGVAVNLAALVTLWYTGYRPTSPLGESEAKILTRRRTAVLLVSVVAIGGVLGGMTFTAYQTGTTTQAIREDVNSVLTAPRYSELSLLELDVRYEQEPLTRRPTRVIVTATSPRGEVYPRLADRIDERVESNTSTPVDVEVHFVDVAMSSD